MFCLLIVVRVVIGIIPKKNKMTLKEGPEGERIDSTALDPFFTTWFRVQSKDVKRIRAGKKVKFKDERM